MAISAGDLARQHRPDRPVDVADFPLDPDRLAVLRRGSRRLDQLLVKRRSQAMVLTFRVVQRRAFGDGRLIKNAGEVHALRLRSEEHTSELQSLMRISYAVLCLKQTTHQMNPAQANTHINI